MKTKTRKTRNRIAKKATRKPRPKMTTKKASARSKPQPKVKSHITAPAAEGKVLKMAPRMPGFAEKKFNLRFASEQDYRMAAAQAAAEGMSLNLFIVTQVMKKCGSKITA